MAKLPFDFSGYEFQRNLDVLRKSSQTGLAALSREINALQQQLEDYHRAGKFEGERDENGDLLWERDRVLNYEISVANDALVELRKAFAVAAYHHWERSVQQWIAVFDGSDKKRTRYDHNRLLSAAKDAGYPPDPELVRVVSLANALKHNSERYGLMLLAVWPEIFPRQFRGPPKLSKWAYSIQLTDEHLNEIFDIVQKSGRTADMLHVNNPPVQ